MVFGISSCGEDSLSVDDSLSSTMYDAEGGAEGSLGAQIDAFYEKYGSKIIYKFSATDLSFGWTSKKELWYVPADTTGNYISRMITKLDEELLSDYPAEFVKKFMPYRIFLCDSLCSSDDYSSSYLEDVYEVKTHGMALSHVGPDMDEMSDADWAEVKSSINSLILGSVMSTAGVEPTEFNGLYTSYGVESEAVDPEGEFTNAEYSLLNTGLVGGSIWDSYYSSNEYVCGLTKTEPNGISLIFRNGDDGDFGYYINFIINNKKAYLDKVFARFPVVKKKARLVYEYMHDNTDTNLIEYQNNLCPDDPIPSGYFIQ